MHVRFDPAAHWLESKSLSHGRRLRRNVHHRGEAKSEKPAVSRGLFIIPGNDLLSRTVTSTVPSALRGLTAVFGMGTGVSPSVESPENLISGAALNTGLGWTFCAGLQTA